MKVENTREERSGSETRKENLRADESQRIENLRANEKIDEEERGSLSSRSFISRDSLYYTIKTTRWDML